MGMKNSIKGNSSSHRKRNQKNGVEESGNSFQTSFDCKLQICKPTTNKADRNWWVPRSHLVLYNMQSEQLHCSRLLNYGNNRGDSAVFRASASKSVDLGSFSNRVIPKYFKKWYSQLPCLVLSKIGVVWRTSQQTCLLCPWARHLTGCLRLYVAYRWWGQAVYPSWWP